MTFPPYLAAIPCRLSASVFSGECVFDVALANGERYESTSPRHFCWTAAGELVADDSPLPRDASVSGYIAVKLRDLSPEGEAIVEVPDSVRIAVRSADVRARPTVIVPPGAVPA